MPTKPTTTISTVGSQRDRRYLDTFFDQHKSPRFPGGRPWWGTREFAANQGDKDGFVGGELTPGRHVEPGEDPKLAWADAWEAPWVPEFKYFEFNYLRNRINIRYDRVIGDDTIGLNNYYDAATRICYEKQWPVVEYGAVPPHAILALLGPVPRSPKIAQAAQAGDPWLIGSSQEPNEELAKLLGLSRRGFIDPSINLAKPTPEKVQEVLGADAATLKAMIDAAVQAALEADRAARKATGQRLNAAKKAKAEKERRGVAANA